MIGVGGTRASFEKLFGIVDVTGLISERMRS